MESRKIGEIILGKKQLKMLLSFYGIPQKDFIELLIYRFSEKDDDYELSIKIKVIYQDESNKAIAEDEFSEKDFYDIFDEEMYGEKSCSCCQKDDVISMNKEEEKKQI